MAGQALLRKNLKRETPGESDAPDPTQCALCDEGYSNAKYAVTYVCGHGVCIICAVNWAQEKETCPICRC